jgi:myo-inositol 2-dehydrogenase/D-chiro-inositol 1-dehydrogenase
MPLQRIKVGIIGAGRIGQIHCKNLASFKDVEVVAVVDANLEAARACAATHGIAVASSDNRTLLGDTGVDAVVVCSPTDTHLTLVEQAATSAKHVFCEKPLGFDLDKTDAVLAVVHRAGVKLQVGLNRRFDPHFAKLREVVRAGTAGELQMVRITSRDPAPPSLDYIAHSGGLFLDMAIHDFDMLRFLVNDTPEKVHAVGSVLVDRRIGAAGDIDTAITTLQFRSGVLAAIENCRQSAFGYDQRIEVFGGKGAVAVGNVAPTSYVIGDAKGLHSPCPYYFFLERYEQAYVHEMRAFIDCVANDTPPSVTGEDARIATALGMAALQSYRERREVRLDELIDIKR